MLRPLLPILPVILLLVPAPARAQVDTISTDRLGWTQTMTAAEQPAITFALFVDGVRAPLPSATCTASTTAGIFDCSSAYPAMTPGAHTLELIAIRTEGTLTAESDKSAPFAIRLIVGPPPPENLRNIRGGG